MLLIVITCVAGIKWGFSPPRIIAPSQHRLDRGGAPGGPHVPNHSVNDATDLGER